MSGVQKNTIFNTDGLSVQSNSTSKSELHKQSKDESNGLLKDGTKVDTDITYKLSHGKPKQPLRFSEISSLDRRFHICFIDVCSWWLMGKLSRVALLINYVFLQLL